MLASRHDTNTTRIGNLLDKHLRKASASDADSPAQNSHHFITFVDGFSYEDQDGASLEVRRLLLQHIGPEEGLYDCSQWARELKGAVIWVGPNSCFMVSPTGRTIDWSRVRDRRSTSDQYKDAVLHTFHATRLNDKWVREVIASKYPRLK